MPSTPNLGGRPTIGPKVETRLHPDALAKVEADARARGLSRADWLRKAALDALPYDCLAPQGVDALRGALADLDTLSYRRDDALDPEVPVDERVIAGAQYAETIHQMRVLLSRVREGLPVEEARDAYRAASAADPDTTRTETATAWARCAAADHLSALVDAVALLLPVDDGSVQKRARLDDPLMDLGE